ncbi:hypothetical protein M422DRAFT_261520 [Sphaerobolus stellatus SS14]|uniref:Protein kinase domain-containing protein n=1 Tax=Sphaerobolus stellatus (strain SS14) TaxID=990650 RepID=A0A0C9UMV9_SPHS4|nr:hypothetical protein M422DRAFT_261520 [Sphaerobolus stellatus SS14]
MFLRSPIPFPDVPLETKERMRLRCPRDHVADALTSGTTSNNSFTFEIRDVIRAKSNTFSQVFSGHVVDSKGRASVLHCLKLFDERIFSIRSCPTDDSAEEGLQWNPPHERLSVWKMAEDLARNEEAAYSRLAGFQGGILSHCYGLHHFILPGNYRCTGLIMEMIYDIHVSGENFKPFSKAEHKEIARHAMRVLRYGQILQTDWHPKQILIPRRESSNKPLNLVFIDFAFSEQHIDISFSPLGQDLYKCRFIFMEATGDWGMVEDQWFPQDQHEW